MEETKYSEEKLIERIDSLQLSKQANEIIKMRFGIGVEKPFTIEEIMRLFNLTKEQVWQIERKIRLLLRPVKRRLKDYLMDVSDDFGKHPSVKLQQAFSQRPFQIQEPEKAKIIFLGLDANLDKDIEEKDEWFFKEMLLYLSDGVEYWKSHGYHSPMLKPAYRGRGGERYHKQFRKLNFTRDNAEDICFMELLKFCTYGRTTDNLKLFKELLGSKENSDHLARIKNLYEMENRICISKTVKQIIDKFGIFNTNTEKIIIHNHFSAPNVTNDELSELGGELLEYINKTKR